MHHDTARKSDDSLDQAEARLPSLACFACGYDLRGFIVDGGCPECGEAIVRSIHAQRGFTKRELAAFACKLFAIWLMLITLEGLRQSWLLFALFNQGMFGSIEMWAIVWTIFMAIVAPALLSILFWWRSGWMARLI
ncbi:MAG: hypothetical protein ACODAQ_04075, partial [Phycisphaeraceae bacterium]